MDLIVPLFAKEMLIEISIDNYYDLPILSVFIAFIRCRVYQKIEIWRAPFPPPSKSQSIEISIGLLISKNTLEFILNGRNDRGKAVRYLYSYAA